MNLSRPNPMNPPMVLAGKRNEYYVSTLFLYLARKGMIGPILPVRNPIVKRTKE